MTIVKQRWQWLVLGVLLVVLTGSPAFSATIEVPGDLEGIQKAVDWARPGDTILIRPGIYHEHIVIPKPLILMGISESRPTEVGGGLLPSLEGCPVTGCTQPVIISPPSLPAIEIRSDNVILKGLRLESTDTCLVLENADHISVNNCSFHDCRTCITGFDTIGSRIEGNSFVQCRKTALQLTSGTEILVNANRFQGGITGIRGDGITRWHVQENRFQNLSVAANMNGMIDSVMRSNTLTNCTLGYLIISSRNTTISGETLENSTQFLFLLNSFSTDVTIGAYGDTTTIAKDIDSSSTYRIGRATLVGNNFAFSLYPQTRIEGYQIAGDRIHITLLGTPGGEQASVKLEARENLKEWERIDPLSFGFYRLDGRRPMFTGSTYVTDNQLQTSATLEGMADGSYALMAKRKVPFGSTIEGIALVIVIFAAVAAFALHRRHRSKKRREAQSSQISRISMAK